MVNSEEFTIRLQKILTFYSLSAAAFAEKIGIGRSSISHIISGRNKPSLEFVLHILDSFDEVSFDWLIYGKGLFPKTDVPTSMVENKNTKNISPEQQAVFSNTNADIGETNLFSNTVVNESVENKPITTHQHSNNSTTIDRIIIFYTNGSFSEYKN